MGLIQNYAQLATSQTRRDVLDVIEAGLQSIQPETVMWDRFLTEGSRLTVKGDEKYEADVNDYDSVNLIAFGKGAATLAKHAARRLRTRLRWGYAIDSVERDIEDDARYPNVTFRTGSHPIPTEEGAGHTREAVNYLKQTSGRELTIAIVCGGASAMFTDPYMGAAKMAELTKELIRSGADISEINTVRKHVDGVKGGGLARELYREDRNIVSLLFSDVPTIKDPKSFIASGPTVMDATTNKDAIDVLRGHGISWVDPAHIRETEKDPKYFARVSNVMVLDNSVPLEAMMAKAEKLGYTPKIAATDMGGEARKAARSFMGMLGTEGYDMLLAGGETTVKVLNKGGSGGRNREFVLGSLLAMPPGTVVASVGTDGWDYMDYAGAIADFSTTKAAADKGINVENMLDRNDSQKFFDATGGNVYTGRMPTNVADLAVFAREKKIVQ